jgi:hypothetical protein
MYFVSYSGVLRAIKIGGVAGLAGIDCNRGQPVMLYNDNSGYSGAIRGPVDRGWLSEQGQRGAMADAG